MHQQRSPHWIWSDWSLWMEPQSPDQSGPPKAGARLVHLTICRPRPPPRRASPLPQGTARGSCSLLRSQSPEIPSSLYPPPLSTDRSLLPVCEPSAHLLVPGLIPIAVHSHPHPHRNKPSQTQQPKTTQICYLAVLDVRSSKCTILS